MNFSMEKNVLLSSLTYFGVGGKADELGRISDIQVLPEIWAETIALKLPHFILGSGSNLVCSDAGFRGRIFIIDAKKTEWKENVVTVEAGKNLQQFILEAAGRGFADVTNLAGIPGTVGGAVRGNAGAFGSETKDCLQSVQFCDEDGMIRILPARECKFAYRESIFKKNPQWCILRATFRLTQKIDRDTALNNAQHLIQERWKKYPPGKCGGSFFKNPTTVTEGAMPYAGWLLENSGAKGDQIGGAQISEKHANFLMNDENATQKDVLELARKWHKIVFEKYNVSLEPEVMLIDEYGKKILI
jgi:UDP-N-acetylmuramate dehydrogenase